MSTLDIESGDHESRLAAWTAASVPAQPRSDAKMVAAINWASSAPGIDWPETYWCSHDPGEDLWVLWAETDTGEEYGLEGAPILAVAWGRGDVSEKEAATELLRAFWSRHARMMAKALPDDTPSGFESLDATGVLTEREVMRLAGEIWPGWAEDEPSGSDAPDEPRLFGRLRMHLLRGDTDALLDAARDADTSLRAEAMATLAYVDDERAAAVLIGALSDDAEEVRLGACAGLHGTRDPRAIVPFLSLLRDPSEALRSSAAGNLGPMKDRRAVAALTELLERDVPAVASKAAISLGEIGDTSAVPAVCAALRHPFADVRRAAAQSLGALHDRRAVEPLIAASADDSLRFAAFQALQWLRDERALDSLLAGLDDESPAVRFAAADALGTLRNRQAVTPLVERLSDPDPFVRQRIVGALADIVDERAVAPLITALDDPDAGVREAVVRALASFSGSGAVAHEVMGALLKASQDPESEVQRMAKRVLERWA